MDIGEKIKHLRVERRLKLEDLANSADTNVSTISRLENGKRDVYASVLVRIASALEVSLDWLVDEDQGYPPPEKVERKRERSRR